MKNGLTFLCARQNQQIVNQVRIGLIEGLKTVGRRHKSPFRIKYRAVNGSILGFKIRQNFLDDFRH